MIYFQKYEVTNIAIFIFAFSHKAKKRVVNIDFSTNTLFCAILIYAFSSKVK